ncbi:NRAMP4 [Symbiodinium microadriaticum]|nr:NRAMP4 [Symbiodinium microadriaticum]
MLFARRFLAGPGRWWFRDEPEVQDAPDVQVSSEDAWEDAGRQRSESQVSNLDEWDWDIVEAIEDQSRQNAVLAILPGDFASDAALEPESPARTQGCGSSSCFCCPKASRDTAVRAAPSETVVPENVYVELNPLVERTDVSEPDRPPSPHESVGSDDGAAGLARNVCSTGNLPMHKDHPEQAAPLAGFAAHCGRFASTTTSHWCGRYPGTVPRGSEEELASKLQRQLARAEQEGCVLQSGSRPSAVADVQATTADEAKAARPKSSGTCVQLLYASKRHSLFDFQSTGPDSRMAARSNRPRPPKLSHSGSLDKVDGVLSRQTSKDSSPVALAAFGLLNPPDSHPSTPIGVPELKKPLALDDVNEELVERGRETWHAWLQRLLVFTGPGWLMSIAYVDPGNLEADLQVGAQFGYSLLWALTGATFMGLGMQLLAARLGCATKRHLAEHCRDAFEFPLRQLLWMLTELAIVGSDIQEVIGCSIGLELLFGIPLTVGVLITAFAAFIFLFLERLGTRPLELFFGVLILILALSMGRLYARICPDSMAVAEGLLVPWLPPSAMQQVVGMVGCVIMPHNLFLHSALVQSRVVQPGGEADAVWLFTVESTCAIVTSLIINTFVVAVFAKGFFGKPGTDAIGLANAGQYLGEAFGEPMKIVWALGLCAAGQSSTMTGAYAGQWVMQGYLDLKVAPWKRAIITRSMALVPCLAVAIYFRGQRDGLDILNTYLNVLQSAVLPFAAVPLLLFAGSKRVMDNLVLSNTSLIAAWSATSLIICANLYLAVQQFAGYGMARMQVGCTIYMLTIIYVAWKGHQAVR